MPRFLLLMILFISGLSAQEVYFNEIRANDEGTDDAEFIELIGPCGFDLSGWAVTHVNGTGGSPVFTFVFPESTFIPDKGLRFPDGTPVGLILLRNGNHNVPDADFDWGTTGLQNGPDGLELTDAEGSRVQALTWNGTGDLTGGDPPWRNIGSDGNDDRSLCAPDSFAEHNQAVWEYLNPTPGAINLNQSAQDISLPVQLLSFTASVRENQVYLQWETAAEVDNLGFIIRRSEDAQGPFQTIASYKTESALEGAGNSSQPHQYVYKDPAVFDGNTYWYELYDVDINGRETLQRTISVTIGSTGNEPVETETIDLPLKFNLYPNRPNPFNPGTRISFDIPHETYADLSVFDVLGRKVVTIFSGEIDARSHEYYWNGLDAAGRDVPSGFYFCILSSRDYYAGRKMLLIR